MCRPLRLCCSWCRLCLWRPTSRCGCHIGILIRFRLLQHNVAYMFINTDSLHVNTFHLSSQKKKENWALFAFYGNCFFNISGILLYAFATSQLEVINLANNANNIALLYQPEFLLWLVYFLGLFNLKIFMLAIDFRLL